MEYDELTVEERGKLFSIRQQKIQVIKNIESLKLELHDITNHIENLGFTIDGEDPAIRRLTLGCKKFNSNIKQGLDYLFEHKIIDQTPDAVAQFFMDQNHNLSKNAIGTYIGEVRKQFNMDVLDAFTKLHDFKDFDFLCSLRLFLLSFQLPGESQKIDRVLTAFSDRYVEQNPLMFNSSHEAYLLAYAVVLLNTTLHNTNAKCQTTGLADEKTFIRTIVEETKLTDEFVRKIYHAIKSEPLRVVCDDNLNNGQLHSNAIMKGWLWKLGGRVKSWKRRWFVLTDDCLLYYLSPDRARQTKGVIQLDGIHIRLVQDKTKDYCFELYCPPNQMIKACKVDREWVSLQGNHTVYRMASASMSERDEWIRSLERITHQIAERRGQRSISMDCTGSGIRADMAATDSQTSNYALPAPVSSLSLKRNGASGSQPDLPSQHSSTVLN